MSYLPYIGTGLVCLVAGFLLAYLACRRAQTRLNQPQSSPRAADPTPSPREGADASYFERLIKFIPGELVAAYLAVDGVLREAVLAAPLWTHWTAFLALLILCPLYVIYRPTHSELTEHSERFHAVASFVAFAVWVFALGGPFVHTWPDLYRPVFGSLLLIITTLALPVLEKMATNLPFFRK